MNAIKKWCTLCSVLFVISILFTALFTAMQALKFALVFCIADTVLFIFLYRQIRLLHNTNLICSNGILYVTSAIITEGNCADRKILNETVVSTFGLLLGSKVYIWGCEGVRGTRLKQVCLDRERIWLTFGTDDETRCIELLHGMADKQNIMEITQKLQHETGVTALITDW